MLVSLKEVGKYVDISSLTPEEIASKLTFAGIEVEEIKKSANATNLVIGEVLTCENHPNSDHLHVCKVDIKGEILDIVCGAPNVRKGLKVIVAKVGAKLGDKTINAGEIRGVKSNGMLCALNELGVDPKYLKPEQIAGIEELSDDAVVGDEDVLGYLGLDDTILDLNLLANRSDCYSLFNVAREIGGLFNLPVNIPEYDEIKTYEDDEFVISSESDNSPLFYGKIFKGIEVKESPLWLKNVLQSEGIRSINNLVDLGNYVMLLTGQPLHLYDYDNLKKKELIIKDDISEEFVALVDKTYSIIPGDLCVTSNNETMCLAGIMGGKYSEIEETSKNFVLEVANFHFASIRKTSTRLGLSSDSSLRFSKGINKDQADYVINLFTHLLKEVSKVDSISQTIIYDTLTHENKEIECSLSYINNRLGSNFTINEVKECLTRLSFKVIDLDETNNTFKVIVPSFRIDVNEKADLSEEVIRFYGFDRITNELPVMETTRGTLSSLRVKERMIESYLLSNNFNEVLTYTLISKKDNEMFNYLNNSESIRIFNPLSEDRSIIRKNLLTSLLRNVEYNLNHQNYDFNVFEISNVYFGVNKEETHLALAMIGNKLLQDDIVLGPKTFYDAKGIFEGILKMLNIDSNRVKYNLLSEEELSRNEFHPYRSTKVVIDGKVVAVIGEIHPLKRNEFSIKKDCVVLMEINLTNLFNVRSANNKYLEFSKYPSVTRDFAFIVSEEYKYIDIRNEVKKCSSLIKDVKLFDIYKGEHVEKGHISLALSITLEKLDSTLKEDEINAVDNRIKESLINKFKVKFRG